MKPRHACDKGRDNFNALVTVILSRDKRAVFGVFMRRDRAKKHDLTDVIFRGCTYKYQ
jgi:hypothetical protein